jgi:hypothetical protein
MQAYSSTRLQTAQRSRDWSWQGESAVFAVQALLARGLLSSGGTDARGRLEAFQDNRRVAALDGNGNAVDEVLVEVEVWKSSNPTL